MMRALTILVPVLALLAAGPAAAETCAPWVDGATLGLERVLPPPPEPASPEAEADMKALRAAVAARTPADEARIESDITYTLDQFAGVLGPAYTAARAPRLAALVARLYKTSSAAVNAAKHAYQRPRPYTLDPGLRTFGDRSHSTSYPGGHAAFGTLTATMLAQIVPERRRALLARAQVYAHARTEAGTHFLTDLEAGRIAGMILAEVLLRDPGFRCDLAAATAEVRAAER
ncbi:phosphatase PAP2 family protein [Methylobacterium sp. NEAU 140]|uniref:phosphatase PAP2 family protein n=1 Tax=Methylobacterium sp. NEAU 140 TaxID=3064945 RepID=UPI002735B8CC|nr:phosphatase PAP2 family protein [Methylobacterium sp. NEAU 140]MDP4025471.1 phosphatase PAP2 family protein [Methylobacterium sp. NEAU 140]